MTSRKTIGYLIIGVVTLVLVFCFFGRDPSMLNQGVLHAVSEKGTPTFLAKTVEVDKRDMKVLQLLLLAQDPQAVETWTSITNTVLVWAEFEPGRRNARYFYDEMKNDKTFDGKGWYSSRSLFNGEKVTIVKIDEHGIAVHQECIRVDAFSLRLMGFIPSSPSTNDSIQLDASSLGENVPK